MAMDSRPELITWLAERRARWVRLSRRWVSSEADAEDLVDDALAKLVRGAPVPADGRSRWFTTVLRHAAVDRARRAEAERKKREGLAHEPRTDDAPAHSCRCVLALTGTLKPEYADALRTTYVEGASLQERAGLTATNAGVRLHRARKKLKSAVVAHCGACAEAGCVDCDCSQESPPGV
jgi:RNA polymerase sigma-70 factor (ECF subfamily)